MTGAPASTKMQANPPRSHVTTILAAARVAAVIRGTVAKDPAAKDVATQDMAKAVPSRRPPAPMGIVPPAPAGHSAGGGILDRGSITIRRLRPARNKANMNELGHRKPAREAVYRASLSSTAAARLRVPHPNPITIGARSADLIRRRLWLKKN